MIIEQYRMNNILKNAEKKSCGLCDFECSKQSDWTRHIVTVKHVNRTKLNNLEQKNAKKLFECKTCCKMYTARNSLWYHEQKCNLGTITPANDARQLTELTMKLVVQNQELIKENNEFKNLILEIIKKDTYNNSNNNTNSNNKTFNMQIFLNEDCKDAMNISEFINSIQLKISDLENVGKLGYIEGISNIIIKQLNSTDMYKRPIHCSDIKRETIYIKEEDKWEKENTENTKMKKMINTVGSKNIGMITKWTDKHPNYKESTSHDNDTYLNLVMESMSGDEEHVTKVIKKISKEVVIK